MHTVDKLLFGAAAGAIAGAAALVWTAGKRRRERRSVWAEITTPEVCEERHARKVNRVARQLRQRQSTAPVSLQKKAVSHMVPKPHDRRYKDEKIDVGDLNAILMIDS